MKKISYQEACRLNDEILEEFIEKAKEKELSFEEIKKELESIWDRIAEHIDFNL